MKKILSIILLAAMLLVSMAGATYTAISATMSLDEQNDAATAPGSWTTLAGNGSVNYYDWPEGYDLFVLANVTGILSTNYLSIMAGDGAHAFRGALGNKTISGWTDGGSEVRIFGPLESARFKNATGYLEISSKNLTGKVAVLKVA